jgi:anti-anti-sigma factor
MVPEHRPWRYGEATAVRLTDETFVEGMAGLRWQLRAHLANGARYLLVDVSKVRHLSSTALAALLGAHRVCRTRGGAVVLCNPSRKTLDLLTRTGLDHVFRIDSADRRTSTSEPERPILSVGKPGVPPPDLPTD